MEFGGHMSSAGGIYTAIDRIEAIGGDCVQVFTQSPRMWKPTAHTPEAIERFKARRAEAGIGGVVCHALYLCNLAAPDDAIYEKSIATMRATLEAANAIEADAVIFHVGSHLGAGFDASLERVVAALAADPRRLRRRHLARDGELGRRRAGRSAARSTELATLVDALDRHPRLGICLDSCHLYASGYDVDRPGRGRRARRRGRRDDRARPAARAARQRQPTPLGSNRDRHANILEGEIGEGLGAFLAHPAFQELCAYWRCRGRATGPDENELAKVRELHARWLTKRRPRSAPAQVARRPRPVAVSEACSSRPRHSPQAASSRRRPRRGVFGCSTASQSARLRDLPGVQHLRHGSERRPAEAPCRDPAFDGCSPHRSSVTPASPLRSSRDRRRWPQLRATRSPFQALGRPAAPATPDATPALARSSDHFGL